METFFLINLWLRSELPRSMAYQRKNKIIKVATGCAQAIKSKHSKAIFEGTCSWTQCETNEVCHVCLCLSWEKSNTKCFGMNSNKRKTKKPKRRTISITSKNKPCSNYVWLGVLADRCHHWRSWH